MIKIKKSNGFTLIEGALVAGIVTIAASAIYSVYSQKNTENLVDKQVSMVKQIHDSLNGYISSVDPAYSVVYGSGRFVRSRYYSQIKNLVEDQANLISNKIIPEEMIGTNNEIKSVWGGDVIFRSDLTGEMVYTRLESGAFVGRGESNKYKIIFYNVPKESCMKFVSNPEIRKITEKISIDMFDDNPAACGSRDNSRITLYMKPPQIDPVESTSTGIAGSVRGGELSQFIAPVDRNMTTPTSCFGFSTWNSNVGACTCPASSKWNGKQCVSFGVDGVCDIGEFWNQKTRSCQTLCSANEKFDPFRQACVSEPATLKTFCIPGVSNSCITSPSKILAGSTYQAGRHIPNTVFQEPQRSAINGLNTNIVFTAQTNRMQPL